MSLMSPVSFVSDGFSSYCVHFYLIYCTWYHSMNQIRSMTSLTMMGLIPGLLVRVLFLFALINLFCCVGDSVGSVGDSVDSVSSVGSTFFVSTGIESIGDIVLLVVFVPKAFDSKSG